MNKLLKPLCIILTVLAGVAISGWRGAKKTANTAAADLAVSSNKLVEATGKIAEKDAANQTLQTKMNLHLTDQAGLSNRLATVNRELAKTTEALKAAIEESHRCNSRLAALTTEFFAGKESLGGELRTKSHEVEKLQESVREAQGWVADLKAALNRAETEKAELLQQWNDPSALRVQAQKLTASPASASKSRTAKLVLQPDGTVVATQFSAVPPPSNPRLQPATVDGTAH